MSSSPPHSTNSCNTRGLKLSLLLWSVLPIAAVAQINYTGGNYTQDFNSLESGVIYRYYTTLPAGWVVSSGAYVWTPVTNGYSGNYGTYSFSLSANDPDKAIGLVIGSTGPAYLGAQFRNATGVALDSFSLTYFAEQWAKGVVSSNDQVIPFEFSLDATNLTSGTFTPAPALDMHSINDGNGSFAALNGNLPANRQCIAATVSGFSWLPNQDLWIRWRGVSYGFLTAHALAIDDLCFRAVPALQIAPSGSSHIRLAWSTNYPGYTLECASNSTLMAWRRLTNEVSTAGTELTVDVEATLEHCLFRLEKR